MTITEGGTRHRPRNPRGGRLPLLMVLVGVLVLLYPVVATQFNNIKQREFASKYNNDITEAPASDLADDLARARTYNEDLDGIPILDPWLTRVSGTPKSGPYREYLDELSRFDVMARVRVPSAQVDLPAYHGTTDDVLTRGLGHLYGTSLPIGGVGTHAVLTSHSGLESATLLDHLTDVREGDLIYVDVYGQTLAYQVDQIKVVLPNQIDDLKSVEGADYLTLFTCTPYAVNTHRLLIRGHRVPYEATPETSSPATSGPTLEPWMYGLLGAAAAGVALFVVLAARNRKLLRDSASE